MKKYILIDPPYKVFYGDKIFKAGDTRMNRDGTLDSTARLRDKFDKLDIEIHTADYYFKNKTWIERENASCDYYSLGILENFEALGQRKNINLQAFVVMEPPVVAPHLYLALPRLTKYFKRVYVSNIHGDGYSLDGVNREKLHKFYWPVPFNDVLEKFWNNTDRMNRVVAISSNHNPMLYNLRHFILRKPQSELYSKRIEAVAALSKSGVVDLYGPRWGVWWSPFSMWRPYWKNRNALMSVYKGVCRSKHEVLSHYRFSLCFENMYMTDYITEKIFDCIYAGTIPLYLGAKNISDLIPPNVYVDCRNYSSWDGMWESVREMPDSRIQDMKEAGRVFVRKYGLRYYNSLEEIVIP